MGIIKITLNWSVFLLLLSACAGSQDQPVDDLYEYPAAPPNIVVFMVDDMGWQDTSVPFHSDTTELNRRYRTPNMERLAATGVKFTQAYATPVCSPTRISFITGLNAARHRVTNWTLQPNTPTDRYDDELIFPPWNMNGLTTRPGDTLAVYVPPLPAVLAARGYHTIHAGKAHFGAIGTPGADPLNLGFQVNIAGHAAGAPGSYYGTQDFGNADTTRRIWAVPGLEDYHGQEIYLTEALTREALRALDEVPADTPFFLYLAHYAVHTPIQGDPRFMPSYLQDGLDSTEAAYASMVEGMDKSLGDVLDYLQENDLQENTIILFMSDNGGLSAHARGGEPHTHNLPLKSGKGSLYEGGIREPMLVRWPGVTTPGSLTGEQVIIEDFYPTLLEVAGIDSTRIPENTDGESFLHILTGGETEDDNRVLVWHYPNRWGGTGPGIDPGSAIRAGDWKLIHFYRDGRQELYNLREDIGEQNDLSEGRPDKTKELAALLTRRLREYNAQLPSFRESGEQVPYPDGSR